ncbi:MAG: hypothetical protein JST11_28460 [Acidobacteria bacterium]|nr:hypothetical protein [Acidobacteriota bacterium]
MKSLLVVALALMGGGIPTRAGTIDVSAADMVRLHTGDTLTFTLQTFSYTRSAAAYGLSPEPTGFRFSLVTAPTEQSGVFGAMLSSADASYDVELGGTLGFTAGSLGSSKYRGAVSTVSGQFQLSAAEAGQLFRGSVVRLSLVNLGADVTLGLGGLLMPCDLYGSLLGDRLTVGAMTVSADLERGVAMMGASVAAEGVGGAAVPEPASSVLMLGGGVLLCGFSGLLTRLTHTRE